MTQCMGTGATEEIKMKNKKNYSKEFKDFILALQAWIEEGCPPPTPGRHVALGFRKYDSICFQPVRWTQDDSVVMLIEADLSHAFRASGLDHHLPFNDVRQYDLEMDTGAHYDNPERLAWIKMMADNFKAEENK